MSRRSQFKAQASSSRLAFGASDAAFGSGSSLSYLAEQPDLSTLSEPNLVVSFKNLSKKASTTRSKAAEEIQTWCSSQSSPEDAFLDAWAKVYPRLTVDDSRRVRQVAHAIQGQVAASSGKRIVKYLPGIAGVWFVGLFDTDKSVAQSADSALSKTFPSEEKRAGFVKTFQSTIITFCKDAVLDETPKTLSDERSTSPEDAEMKHHRLIIGTVTALTHLLRQHDRSHIYKDQQLLEEILQSPALWLFLSSKDAQVRRALLNLLQVCLAEHRDLVSHQSQLISKSLMSKTTARHQAGSALAYSEAVIAHLGAFPGAWATSGKASPLESFQNIIRYGSQGAPSRFWDNTSKIAQLLPRDQAPETLASIKSVSESFISGITRRDEPRTNADAAWSSYFQTLEILTKKSDKQLRNDAFTELILPLVRQLLAPTTEGPKISVAASSFADMLARFCTNADVWDQIANHWSSLSEHVVQSVKTSAPAQSKDFGQSQNAVRVEAQRWFAVQTQLLKSQATQEFVEAAASSTTVIVEASAENLNSRNGKPFGAAATIEAALRSAPQLFASNPSLAATVDVLVTRDIPKLILSPSSTSLVNILYMRRTENGFVAAWNATLDAVLDAPDSPLKIVAIDALLSPSTLPSDFKLPEESTKLQRAVIRQSLSLLEASPGAVSNDARNLGPLSPVLSSRSADEILTKMTENLSLQTHTTTTLKTLEQMAVENPGHVGAFLTSSEGPRLLQALLRLSEVTNDEDSETATHVSAVLAKINVNNQGSRNIHSSALEVIQRELYDANSRSVTIATLLENVRNYIDGSEDAIRKAMPDTTKWTEILQKLLDQKPPASSSFINALGGSIFRVESVPDMDRPYLRDADGICVPIRIALMASDELSIAGTNRAWEPHHNVLDNTMLDFTTDVQQLLKTVSKEDMVSIKQGLWASIKDNSPASFAFARQYSAAVSESIEANGWQDMDFDIEEELKSLRRTTNIFSLTAFLTAYQSPLSSSSYITRYANELIADLTAASVESQGEAVQLLLVLNIILSTQEHVIDTVAKQRLVFFVKHVVEWLSHGGPTEHLELKSEVLRVLALVLPAINDIYGEVWEATLKYLHLGLRGSGKINPRTATSVQVCLLHASLKLLALLRGLLRDEETNDDLKEAWTENQPTISEALVECLKQSSSVADIYNQPLRILNELLSRQVKSLVSISGEQLADMFPLVHAESASIQQIAFELLHKRIPKEQEEVSLNAALDKTTQKLPAALLSLVMDSPSIESLEDEDFESAMPAPIRSYLSSWLLVFDHFRGASDKVKADYAVQIKEEGFLDNLLLFIFDFLGHSRGKPIDVSKFSVSTYSFDIEDNPVKDIQWLLTHLYFLTLKRLPILAKNWWLDCKSRQTRVNMEAWTEKYISPCIISDSLAAVDDWASAQGGDADEALAVKTNPRAGEIIASREIDEQQLSIVIRLPATFPLAQALVESRNRVAVDERKWRSWLLNCQGVIQFSNNSITDGLVAFRRNVTGALKGQTECAICYSLVSGDKQLPTKKCGTCKNAFHGSCLYRWFKSSNSSSCPLCRNPFNYS